VETVLRNITGNIDFVFSRREYFSTFERRDASYALNQTLTFVTKIILKYIWDCKLRFSTPSSDGCLDNIKEKLQLQYELNSSISKITVSSGFPFFARENFTNDNNIIL
jgi:hypothetical protein